MSSSSDSEEDDIFRSICDPTLPDVYTKKKTSKADKVEEAIKDEENGDMRETFVLLRKIQRCIAVNGAQTVRGSCIDGSEKVRAVRNAADVESKRIGEALLPSTKSKYVAKKLSALLDEKIVMTPNDDSVPEVKPQSSKQDSSYFHILKNVVIDKLSKDKTNRQKKKQKPCLLKHSYYHKMELASRCKSVAVTPEWILNKSGEYPWPHPKNIRYVEEYRMECRKPNGVIVAVPIGKTDANNCTKSNSVNQEEKWKQSAEKTGVKTKGSVSDVGSKRQKKCIVNSNMDRNTDNNNWKRKREKECLWKVH